ncbi:MAG: tyrosine-type recombinase/integrase [Actinomycetaceae bacterium]|nr:tyrosine-type recombinase/integrase [Actinomycetaceae bacterium]
MAREHFGSIIKAPSGHYYGRYRRKGHEYYTPRVRTKTQVRQQLAAIHAQIVSGEWSPPVKGRQGPPSHRPEDATLAQWAAPILDGLEGSGFSPNTARSYQSIWRRHVLPLIGDVKLADLTEEHSDVVMRTVTASLAPKTARNVMLAFSAVLSRAVADKIIPANPVKVIGARGESMRAPVALTADELNRLIEATPRHLRAAYVLASWGCMRYGEIAALERRDVDLPLVTVSKAIKRAPGGMLVLGPPKSRAGFRTVALTAHAAQIVQDHLDNYTPPAPESLLFRRDGHSTPYVSDKVMRRILADALDKAGLPAMRLHDLRHTGMTLYGQAGATLADLMRRGGHSSPETVMIYQHSDRRRDLELAERMGASQSASSPPTPV